MDHEARTLIYLVSYEVQDIETLVPLLKNKNEIFQYLAVSGISRIALQFCMSSNYESFDYFSQFITEHNAILQMTMIMMMTKSNMIASTIVEFLTFVCEFKTEFENFIIHAFSSQLIQAIISRIKDFELIYKFAVYRMFGQFFDKFTNNAFTEWCVQSPILDLAIEDIANEPDAHTENLLLNLLETLLCQLHFTTKEQRKKLGEI